MFTKQDVTDSIRTAQKALAGAVEKIKAAQKNADPAHNAELMRSLWLAQEQLGSALVKLGTVSSCLNGVSVAVDQSFPADEKVEA